MIEMNGVTSHFKKGEANISAKEQQGEIVYNH